MKQCKEDKLSSAFKSIKIGKANAFIPPKSIAREFSSYVDKQNSKGDVVINIGNGYYRPNPLSPEEKDEFATYLSNEYDRANSIIDKCIKMKFVYDSILEHIVKTWEANSNGQYRKT